jgi:uncharacterized protein
MPILRGTPSKGRKPTNNRLSGEKDRRDQGGAGGLIIPSREEALEILEKSGCPKRVIEHSKNVTALALKIAESFTEKGREVDLELVEIGALLHDIGRSETHKVTHGAIGGKIARELSLPEKIARIIERHVGAGIPKEEADRLGLPPGDYIPRTIEEKIITYADKLIEGRQVVEIDNTIDHFKEDLGDDHPAIERLKKLHTEITCVIGPINQIDLKNQLPQI